MRDDNGSTGPDFGLLYDMRNPSVAQRSFEAFHGEILEQAAWAEQLGMRSIWLAEHHFHEDGSVSSPLLLLSAIAARTTRARLGTAVVVPALHNPIRLAEDVATLSIISNGRFDLGLGLGYREADFEAFGRRLVNRVSLLEEAVEIMRRGLAGKPLEFSARRYRLPGRAISPVPERPPRIFIGAETEPSIERAARIGDGLLAGSNDDYYGLYLAALERAGKDPAHACISVTQRAIVADDPEAVWGQIGDFALYSMNAYARKGILPGIREFRDRDEVLAHGWFTLMDGPMAVAQLTELLRDRPRISDVRLLAMLPGESVASSSARVEYYMRHVVPQVRENLRIGPSGQVKA